MSKPARGTLIVVEGLDRAGKSTQCSRLVQNLEKEGHTVAYMRFPDRTTPIGKLIEQYLKNQLQQEDHAVHLLFSANRWEAADRIKNSIAAGTIVIIDRYYYSGCVYSAAKGIPGIDLEWTRWPDVGLPRPDTCLFLEISPADAAARGGFGEEKYENEAMQGRVRSLFQELRTTFDKDDFTVVDAGRSPELVETDILHHVKSCMQKVLDGSLGRELRVVLPVRS